MDENYRTLTIFDSYSTKKTFDIARYQTFGASSNSLMHGEAKTSISNRTTTQYN